MIAIDLIKEQPLDADPKAIQKNNFTGNINQGEYLNDNKTMFLIIEKQKETILNFSQGTVKLF